MKKIIIFASMLILVLFIFTILQAGTLKPGVQGTYITWDSGMAKMNTDVVENQIKRELDQGIITYANFSSYNNLDVGDPETKGFLYGPAISYETDDKAWEFSASMYWFGSYTTSIDSTVTVNGNLMGYISTTIPIPIKTELEIEYKDIDLRTQRMLTENFGIFGGYKYQQYMSNIKNDYSFAVQPLVTNIVSGSLEFKLDSFMHMLYAGLSFIKPVSESFIFKAHLGGGLPVAGESEQKLKISSTVLPNDIRNNSGKITMAYMLFGDINLGLTLGKKVNLWLGYQYRRLTVEIEKLDLNADGVADEKAKETDLYHGVTFMAEYLIDL